LRLIAHYSAHAFRFFRAWINYKNNIRGMCFFVNAYFHEMPTSAYRSDFRKFDGEIYLKKNGCQKTFSTARLFFPLWEIQCVNADAVGKNWWEKSGTRTFIWKTSQNEKLPWPIWLLVRDVADIQRMRTRVEQGRARRRWRSERRKRERNETRLHN